MRYGRYGWSHFALRLGLGSVFVWIGIDILRHPDVWLGYIPNNVPFNLTRELALQINGGGDIAIGTLLVLNKLPRLTALLAAGHLLGILITQGIDALLIRDVGLLGGAISLLLWPQKHRRSRWWGRRKGRVELPEIN